LNEWNNTHKPLKVELKEYNDLKRKKFEIDDDDIIVDNSFSSFIKVLAIEDTKTLTTDNKKNRKRTPTVNQQVEKRLRQKKGGAYHNIRDPFSVNNNLPIITNSLNTRNVKRQKLSNNFQTPLENSSKIDDPVKEHTQISQEDILQMFESFGKMDILKEIIPQVMRLNRNQNQLLRKRLIWNRLT
jgi:hypothetical protein